MRETHPEYVLTVKKTVFTMTVMYRSYNFFKCLNGHLELVPAFLCSLYLTLYKTDISLRRTAGAGPKGVRLRES